MWLKAKSSQGASPLPVRAVAAPEHSPNPLLLQPRGEAHPRSSERGRDSPYGFMRAGCSCWRERDAALLSPEPTVVSQPPSVHGASTSVAARWCPRIVAFDVQANCLQQTVS